jgi:hypothetical protein
MENVFDINILMYKEPNNWRLYIWANIVDIGRRNNQTTIVYEIEIDNDIKGAVV